jgi:hypothetical protein
VNGNAIGRERRLALLLLDTAPGPGAGSDRLRYGTSGVPVPG